MKGKSSKIVLSIVVIGIFLVAGCASTKQTIKGPEWICKGGGAFDVERGQVFYGVGSASGIKNRALMRDTADNRARKDIALTLGLDKKEFEKKMKDPGVQGRVRRDLLDGRQAGVRSIPAVFINGWVLKSRNLQGFQAAIDKELQRLGKKFDKPAS